jgi:serine/threonine protein kinase
VSAACVALVFFQVLHALNRSGEFGLTPGSEEEESTLKEICREVAVLARLKCPHVVALEGVSFDTVTARPKYIVMELADQSLDRLIHLESELTLVTLIRLCRHVLAGLEYLHNRPEVVIHRDVKPGNILVFSDEGGDLLFKIGDVGLAYFLESVSLSRSNLGAVGTLSYMAPEMSAGRGYNQAIDVFGFGVMIAEIVARKFQTPPLRRFDLGSRMVMVSNAVDCLTSVCNPIAQLIEGCCIEDPEERPCAADAIRLLDAHFPPPDYVSCVFRVGLLKLC